jgi:hypothetical protein
LGKGVIKGQSGFEKESFSVYVFLSYLRLCSLYTLISGKRKVSCETDRDTDRDTQRHRQRHTETQTKIKRVVK